MQFHLARFAGLVLPEFRPRDVHCTSYDHESHAPTLEALFRLKREGELPSPTVPGIYASVVYEEAALARHARVAYLLKKDAWNQPRDSELHSLRALAFVEIEAFLQGITEPYDEACQIVPSLLALPDILDQKMRCALAKDMREVLNTAPKALEPWDAWAFAVAVPALLRAAGARDADVASAQAQLTTRTAAAVEHTLIDEFKTKTEALEALSLPGFLSMESSGWPIERETNDLAFECMKPIWRSEYDKMFKLIEHWCPASAASLRMPIPLDWSEPKATLEIRPHPKNPLLGHAVELTGL